MTSRSSDPLSAVFSALANPTRRDILARLAEGEATVNELAEPFDMTLPAISRHLKVLEDAGLVVRGQRAQFRPVQLDPAPLGEVADWLTTCWAQWQSRFDQLDRYLASLDTPHQQETP